jgi:hypothetical protein
MQRPADAILCAADLVRRDEAVRETAHLEQFARYPVRIELGGVVVEVRFEWPNAAEVYRRRYRHALSTGTPRFTACVANWKPGEVYFWFPGLATYFWGHWDLGSNDLAFLTDAVVTTTLFTASEDLIALHAAVVGDGACAAAIVGTTTAGKSTTAIACARRGLDLYSDEFGIVTPHGVMPCQRALNLRSGGIELLRQDRAPNSPVDAWLRSHRGDCDGVGYDELFGELHVPALRPLRLAFILAGAGPHPQVRLLSAPQMLVHLEPWARMKARGIEAAGELLALLKSVDSYELTLGKPDDTARLIRAMLAEASDAKRIA